MPGSEVTSPATVMSRRPSNASRRFVAATLIDAVGSGLWMPFALLFLVHAQRMSLTQAGAALSVGALLGLAAGPGSGALMDRVGPVTVLVTSNLIRLAAFTCYPLVSSLWQVVLVATAVSVGDRLFWTANAPLVDALTVGRDSEKLFGTQAIGRFLGSGVGAGATALMPSFTSASTDHVLAYLNAASFAIAGLLITGLRPPVHHRAQGTDAGVGWAVVLRDRAYLGFCASHVLFTLASVGKYSILPILVLDVLHGPQWVPGIAMAIGAVVLVTTQRPVILLAARRSRAAGLITAALVFACSFAVLVPATALPLTMAIGAPVLPSRSLKPCSPRWPRPRPRRPHRWVREAARARCSSCRGQCPASLGLRCLPACSPSGTRHCGWCSPLPPHWPCPPCWPCGGLFPPVCSRDQGLAG